MGRVSKGAVVGSMIMTTTSERVLEVRTLVIHWPGDVEVHHGSLTRLTTRVSRVSQLFAFLQARDAATCWPFCSAMDKVWGFRIVLSDWAPSVCD